MGDDENDYDDVADSDSDDGSEDDSDNDSHDDNPFYEDFNKKMDKSFRPKTMRLDWWEASDVVKKNFVNKLFPNIDLSTIFEDKECTICMTDKPSGMFLPCKHVVVCKSCRLADSFKKC